MSDQVSKKQPSSVSDSSKTFAYLSSLPHQRGELSVEAIKGDFASHLRFSLAKDRFSATPRNLFDALALTVRDHLVQGWIRTQQKHHQKRAKRIYYLSLEYLMGRALSNNLINLRAEQSFEQALKDLDIDLAELSAIEVDAGLGNGGLGRLAACFIDSMASLDIPSIGYGLRYDYGIFTQTIQDGEQFEKPDDWLRYGHPWEMPRPEYIQTVRFGGRVETSTVGQEIRFRWVDGQCILGMPYDVPIVGYGGQTVNTLRLWSAKAHQDFDFADFNRGDYFGAVEDKTNAENITKVLYPNDNNYQGKTLRFRQQYFFVSCSLQDIFRRYLAEHDNFDDFVDQVAIQLNDTHPAMTIPELMRLFLDEYHLGWEHAWSLVTQVTGYTNHTLLPEALEQWPVEFFERFLPRHLQIIFEINRRFLRQVKTRFPFDDDRLSRMSLIDEGDGQYKRVRMAHLSIVGSKSVNGVAALHTQLLKTRLFSDFFALSPEKFNNKTNGVTPRRWLRLANPKLAELISESIGEDWLIDLNQLRKLEAMSTDSAFLQKFRDIKQANKNHLAKIIFEQTGVKVSNEAIFDVQVKRLHEYKRQTLNALHIIYLYKRLKDDPSFDILPHVFIFAGKAAPGYFIAKKVIRLVHALGEVINNDVLIRDRLKVVFLPNYSVSLAEQIIPAANISQQISTAGYEASGTGNMKFALNGALTVGTLDGANIEIKEAVGDDNIFIFGMSADEVAAAQADRHEHPGNIYAEEPEVKAVCDLLFSDFFNMDQPGLFDVIKERILNKPDPYMNLADLGTYIKAMANADELYRDTKSWDQHALLNVARMAMFSSDRTIGQYNDEIWKVPQIRSK